jgi:hypothetical protein
LDAPSLYHDVFFEYTPPETGKVRISLCPGPAFPGGLPYFDAVMRVFDGFGEIAYGDQGCFSPPDVAVHLVAGTTYVVLISSYFEDAAGNFRITVEPQFALTIDSHFGPGSLRIKNHHGAPGSLYYTALTMTPTAFPFGWFFGVSPSLIEI